MPAQMQQYFSHLHSASVRSQIEQTTGGMLKL